VTETMNEGSRRWVQGLRVFTRLALTIAALGLLILATPDSWAFWVAVGLLGAVLWAFLVDIITKPSSSGRRIVLNITWIISIVLTGIALLVRLDLLPYAGFAATAVSGYERILHDLEEAAAPT
jgi:hypothetical protein